MIEPGKAIAGWGMMLDEGLPRLLALLGLRLGLPVCELLERLTPRDLVLLADALAHDAETGMDGKPTNEFSRLQAFLTE